MIWITVAVIVVLAFWAIARLHLAGEDLSRFDVPTAPPINDAPSAASEAAVARVRGLIREAEAHKGRQRLLHMRRAMDELGERADLSDLEVTPVTVAGRPAEWLVPRAGEVHGRLLYIHGGAFTMGSPKSHRVITSELARRAGLAVLAVDYRLMPEHSRQDGIDDCRAAYRWILQHGPAGTAAAGPLFVAGDSAGGNLTLTLIAWLRDEVRRGDGELRQADGAMALSPLTDGTFASPSMHYNQDHDPMLGPMVKLILRFPRPLMLWSSWLQNRMAPSNPAVSPVRGALDGLPPVLVQASESEILIDDARRYVNKARHSGSPAALETWQGMVHVWQAFGPELPESEQAFARLADFVKRVRESRDRADAA